MTSCTITGAHLGRLMLKHLRECNQLTFAGNSCEEVHRSHADFFGAVLKETHRLTGAVVEAALKEAYPGMQKFQKTQIQKLLQEAFAALNRKRQNLKSAERQQDFYKAIFKVSGDLPNAGDSASKQQAPLPAAQPVSVMGPAAGSPPARRLARKTSWPENPSVLSAANIEALYGLPSSPAVRIRQPEAPSIESLEAGALVASSPECIADSPSPAQGNKTLQRDLPSWWNTMEQAMELQNPETQQPVFARTELGAKGFLVAHWPDGSTLETDVSNMAMKIAQGHAAGEAQPSRKKPAAARLSKKRPAAAAFVAQGDQDEHAMASEAPPAAAVAQPAPYCTTQTRAESTSFGQIRKFVGKDKGYIQCKTPTKWSCIVNVTGSCCAGHVEKLVNKLMQFCLQPGLTVEAVHTKKTELAAGLRGLDVD